MTFRFLRTKLTVLYMGLFGIALVLVAIAVVTAVTNSARRVVQNELTASGAVYGQVWASRTEQLKQGAAVLAQDYGFREAVATGDEATVRSALDNLRARQGVDGALILGVDGYVTSAGITLDEGSVDALWTGLDSGEMQSGVLSIGGAPHQVVAAPILAPVLIGWVVFAKRLDQAQMRQLESLSAIPLSASIIMRGSPQWRETGTATAAPTTGLTAEGRAMLLARRLPSFDAKAPAALLLSYPLHRAMKPYEGLFLWLALIGAVGLVVLIAGTWALAKGLTRPITDLDQAVHRLQQGEHVQVPVTSVDEIGRLAGSFNAMAGTIRDREARLTHMALHDQETGLPNRLALERQVASGDMAYVVLISLDRFDVVRSAIGYDSMAQLLTALGQRLTALVPGTVLARVGSSAIGMVLEAPDDEVALASAQALCDAAQNPIVVDGAPIDIALTAGLAPTRGVSGDIGSAVDRASIAVDQARVHRRGAALFDAEIYGDPHGNLSLISELMQALRNGEFSLNYQPKYDFRSDRIAGVEALARWTHPRRGPVSPDLFVGMAEETGHIRPLTEWVLRQAVTDQQTLRASGNSLSVSINISGRLLNDHDFADFALAQIEGTDADLCFEITETAVMANPDVALAIIDRFAAAGIAVSIDDYGSGLSSLTYLKQIRADELKIDKSFVMSLDQSARDGMLVKSTIDLAHSLGLKVTAEGVETPTALALLRAMGCDMAQGYLIGRPMPMTALLERLAEPSVAATPARKRVKSAA